jgi:hypothetical protein
MVAHSRKNYYYRIATVQILRIVFDRNVYINNVKPLNDNNGFPLNCYQATKYFKSKKIKGFKVTVKTQLLLCFDSNFKTLLEFKHNGMSLIEIKYTIHNISCGCQLYIHS